AMRCDAPICWLDCSSRTHRPARESQTDSSSMLPTPTADRHLVLLGSCFRSWAEPFRGPGLALDRLEFREREGRQSLDIQRLLFKHRFEDLRRFRTGN